MAEQIKSGWRSSEFQLVALTSLAALLNQSGLLHFQIPVDTLANMFHAVIAYIGSRSLIKAVAAYKLGAKVEDAKTNEG